MAKRKETPLQRELASRGLCSEAEAQRRLEIGFDAYKIFCKSGQLRRVRFSWKGTERFGVPLSEFDELTAVYQGGSLRLARNPGA
jgi:hypothetical protein